MFGVVFGLFSEAVVGSEFMIRYVGVVCLAEVEFVGFSLMLL